MRVAAIDCGTNSIRLLVADVVGGRLTDVHREMRAVRLGEGVDATGVLSGGALDRTWRALSDYAAVLRAAGAVQVRMAATSAARDAANSDEFVTMVRGVLGQAPELISGDQEAGLSFRGAVADLAPDRGPFLVADIGGGSTELAVGTAGPDGPQVAAEVSLDIGSVRITERLLRGDPPTKDELARATGWVGAAVNDGLARLPLSPDMTVVAVSGTSSTIAAAALNLTRLRAGDTHLARIPVDRLRQAAGTLLGATRAHRAMLGYLHPGRVDVIGGGALIMSTLVGKLQRDWAISHVTVSEHDILDGLALSMSPAAG